jgi:5-methylcytosine-specific restriction endonuclease McrA
MSIVHIAFYPSDWLAGTRGLSDAETGVYITLICKMYEMAGPIERDDDRLWRVCGCKSKAAYLKSFDYLVSQGMVVQVGRLLSSDRLRKRWLSFDRAQIQRPSLPESVRAYVINRDEKCCRYCGSNTGPFEIDHVFPWSRGGSDTPENLVVACQTCNRSKGSKLLSEWLEVMN